jgi:hypothetical protein
MALPNSRQTFKEYCLRRLGDPVIEINVDDIQLEDRIDDALSHWRDYHYDGTENVFVAHQIESGDRTNRYIEIPDSIIGVNRVLPFSQGMHSGNIFDVRYQFMLNELQTLISQGGLPYYVILKSHLELIEQVMIGSKPIRFNRHTNRLYIDMDWMNDVSVGSILVYEGYRLLDPKTYPKLWSDRWLLKYGTALFKRQWGENVKKFGGVALPGGLTLNGDKIYEEAVAEIQELEKSMIMDYDYPPMMQVG